MEPCQAVALPVTGGAVTLPLAACPFHWLLLGCPHTQPTIQFPCVWERAVMGSALALQDEELPHCTSAAVAALLSRPALVTSVPWMDFVCFCPVFPHRQTCVFSSLGLNLWAPSWSFWSELSVLEKLLIHRRVAQTLQFPCARPPCTSLREQDLGPSVEVREPGSGS